MHMADALLSPAVGVGLWLASSTATIYAARDVRAYGTVDRAPLMGVLGAFVFAAQMLNFAIPGTGSSGHLSGGLLLAILLGSRSAFVVMASILTAQALLFADGGLLALGANVMNLGFFSCFVAYPLVYRPLAGVNPSPRRLALAAISASIVGLQFGAFAVVFETVASGISRLPFLPFLAFMQPIHLAIGLVEGIVTAAVVLTLMRARPDLFDDATRGISLKPHYKGILTRGTLAIVVVLSLVIGGGVSSLASQNPDGLEWALARVGYHEASARPPAGIHDELATLQERTTAFPGYSLPQSSDLALPSAVSTDSPIARSSLPGAVGVVFVLLFATALGFLLRHLRLRSLPNHQRRQ